MQYYIVFLRGKVVNYMDKSVAGTTEQFIQYK